MANDYSVPEKYKGRMVWSFSKLTSFEDCPKAYYLQRILKVKSKNNIWGVLGGATHDVLEKLIKKEIDKVQAIEIFRDRLDEAKIAGIEFPTPSMEQNYRQSVEHYIEHFVAPDIKDCKIELKQFLEVDDNNVIIGFIDFVILHHDDSIEVRDFKTSSKFSSYELGEKAKQLLIYAEMLKQNYKKVNEVKVSFDMIKYATISHIDKARSRTVDRYKLAVVLKDWIEHDLRELGKYDELDIDGIVLEAITTNTIPKEISHKYNVQPYIKEYPYTESEVNDLYSWIKNSISAIKSTANFKAKITNSKEEFWCTNLCGVNESCEEYKAYLQNKGETKIELNDDDLF